MDCLRTVDIEMTGWECPNVEVPETDGSAYVLIQMRCSESSVQLLPRARQPLPCGLGPMLVGTNDPL